MLSKRIDEWVMTRKDKVSQNGELIEKEAQDNKYSLKKEETYWRGCSVYKNCCPNLGGEHNGKRREENFGKHLGAGKYQDEKLEARTLIEIS